jgi:hypothetical protein
MSTVPGGHQHRGQVISEVATEVSVVIVEGQRRRTYQIESAYRCLVGVEQHVHGGRSGSREVCRKWMLGLVVGEHEYRGGCCVERPNELRRHAADECAPFRPPVVCARHACETAAVRRRMAQGERRKVGAQQSHGAVEDPRGGIGARPSNRSVCVWVDVARRELQRRARGGAADRRGSHVRRVEQ